MRATLPRLRYDQLMRFGWKVLLPVATLNAVVTAILVVLVCDADRRTAKGFGVTFRQIFKKPITQQYPEFKRPVYPRFRGRHRLHLHENGLEKCVGCSLCAAACPADCIRVVAGREHRRQPRLGRRALRAHLRDQHEPLHLLRLLRARLPVRRDHARQRVRDLRVLARRPDLHEGHAARASRSSAFRSPTATSTTRRSRPTRPAAPRWATSSSGSIWILAAVALPRLGARGGHVHEPVLLGARADREPRLARRALPAARRSSSPPRRCSSTPAR